MEINETKVKNIIVKSNLPDTDYVINPYTGCMHNCIYCYACFIENVVRKLHLNLVFDLGGEEVLQSSPLFPYFSIFS